MAPDRGRESREKAEKPQKSEISTYNNWSDVLYVAHEAGIADATLLDCIRRNLLGPIAAERARRQQERNCREMPNAIRPHPEASREAPSIADHIPPHILEHVVATGDLAKLTPQDRLTYYLARCHAARLDPRTVPFQYLTLDGKLVLYATKAAVDQLIAGRRITVEITEKKIDRNYGIFKVQCRATLPGGSWVDDIGLVPVDGLRGNAFCNMVMKGVTKAKRRAVLSACGLGMMDETEVETIPGAEVVPTAEVMPSIARPPAGEPAVGSHREPRAERRRRPPPRPSPPRRPEPEDLSQEGEFAAEDLADDDWEEGRE